MATFRNEGRSATSAEWTQFNPKLRRYEIGVETDTGRVKLGDGVSTWSSLDYMDGGVSPKEFQVFNVNDVNTSSDTWYEVYNEAEVIQVQHESNLGSGGSVTISIANEETFTDITDDTFEVQGKNITPDTAYDFTTNPKFVPGAKIRLVKDATEVIGIIDTVAAGQIVLKETSNQTDTGFTIADWETNAVVVPANTDINLKDTLGSDTNDLFVFVSVGGTVTVKTIKLLSVTQ